MTLFATMGASASNSVSDANCPWNFCRVEHSSGESGTDKRTLNRADL